MKILLAEFFPSPGHKMLFDNTSRLLSKSFEVYSYSVKGVGKGQEKYALPHGYYNSKKNYIIDTICRIFYSLSILRFLIKEARRNNVDIIIGLTYDDVCFFLENWLIPDRYKTFLMHHVNIDNLRTSRIKRLMFNTYKSKYYHIVLGAFIAEYLKDKLFVDSKSVIVWPHPLNKINASIKNINYDCVGLSASNDESIIASLIKYEKETSLFANKKLKIIIKSRLQEYDDDYLKVIKGYIKTDLYNKYIGGARSLLIPFPSSYCMRISGTVMDALSNGKIILGSNIPIIRACKKTYPNLVRLFDIHSFADELQLLIKEADFSNEFDLFVEMHSDKFLAPLMAESIEAVLSGRLFSKKCDF